jgi:hypothetical protein
MLSGAKMSNHLSFVSDSTTAAMATYVGPIVSVLCVLAGLVCVALLVNAGIQYMTSSGSPEKLSHAKKIIKDSLVGLVLVMASATITAVLTHAYNSSAQNPAQNLPKLGTIQPVSASDSLVDVIIKAITGLLDYLIQSIGRPIISSLTYFTSGTPLMATNSSVFKLWLGVVGISDALFVLVVCAVGFHIMSASSLGIEELEIKHLIPKITYVFLLINVSIFLIDGIITLSNGMISALYAGFGNLSVWTVLSAIADQSGTMSLAALIIMAIFLIFSFILLVYYVGRIVTLYLGAVLSPLVMLLWLLPSFQDFASSAIKTYLSTIFVLFVHVIILLLAGSLLANLVSGSGGNDDPIMSLVIGMSTLVALIKTQGVMNQLNYVSIGPKSLRKLGGQLINSINHGTA